MRVLSHLSVARTVHSDSEQMKTASIVGLAASVILGSVLAACGSTSADDFGEDDLSTGPTNASSSSSGGSTTTTSPTDPGPLKTGIPCDVDNILRKKCQTCHSEDPQYGAPQALVTYAQLKNANTLERVVARIKDQARPMPPQPKAMLTADEISTIDSWIRSGAKESAETCNSGATEAAAQKLPCTPDQIVISKTKFTMPTGKADQYVCFGMDIPIAQKRHITAFGPHVDNTKILHHILLFQADSSYGDAMRECAALSSAQWKLMAGWAPGGTNLVLPEVAGFPEEKGTTHWIVQLHYNNVGNLSGQVDNSGFDICTTDQLRPNDAGILAPGSVNFSIPARATCGVTKSYTLPSSFRTPINIFNSSPHMHSRGIAMKTTKTSGGKTEDIFDQPNFSFENQANFPVTKTAKAGDKLTNTCTFKNTSDGTIKFGEDTADEMCFNFLAYYPNNPAVGWATPAISLLPTGCK